jgi:hypothetical protein
MIIITISRLAGGVRSLGPICGRMGVVLPPGSPLLWWNGFPIAFALTCLIELPAYLLAFAALGWSRSRPSPHRPLTTRSAVALALAVNLFSHPLFWLIALRLDDTGRLIIAELGVAVFEGLLIFFVVARRPGYDTMINRFAWAMLSAAGVNMFSLMVGMLVLPLMISS